MAQECKSGKSKPLEDFDTPVLLMQQEPRQVITANSKALRLFKKQLSQVENRRGGEVFDCIHSFTELGCGKDANCEDCKIKNAIVDTFNTGNPHHSVSTTLQIKQDNGTKPYTLQVSTEKIGNEAIVKIERFDEE